MEARGDSFTLVAPFGLARGTVETFSIANPAAGSAAARTTGQGYFERVQTIFCQLVASAVAGNRVVLVQYFDADTNVVAFAASTGVITASQTAQVGFGIGQPATAATAGGRFSAGLPNIYLQPGWRIQVNAIALDAGDQFSLVRGVVERFGIGPDGTPVGEVALPYTERGRGYVRDLESE